MQSHFFFEVDEQKFICIHRYCREKGMNFVLLNVKLGGFLFIALFLQIFQWFFREERIHKNVSVYKDSVA